MTAPAYSGGMSPPVTATMLDDALRARGLRATPQRRLVLKAVAELGHATPEQVCEHVQGESATLNLSTVYRALDLLEELGVVSHTHLTHGSPTYQVADHVDHLHLVCRRCGSITEADLALAGPLATAVDERHGFRTDLPHLSLHGVCASCRAAVGEEGVDEGVDAGEPVASSAHHDHGPGSGSKHDHSTLHRS
jgi:Fur family transcriptional regulator, ferric uptake regulator